MLQEHHYRQKQYGFHDNASSRIIASISVSRGGLLGSLVNLDEIEHVSVRLGFRGRHVQCRLDLLRLPASMIVRRQAYKRPSYGDITSRLIASCTRGSGRHYDSLILATLRRFNLQRVEKTQQRFSNPSVALILEQAACIVQSQPLTGSVEPQGKPNGACVGSTMSLRRKQFVGRGEGGRGDGGARGMGVPYQPISI